MLDLTMPHVDGVETLRGLRSVRADVQVIVASGYAEAEVEARFRDDPPGGFLQKPFDLEALREQLRAAAERGRAPTA